MKHTGLFKTFLSDVVDLNADRLSKLDASVEAIKNFIRASDWDPKVKGFANQGSWAQKTIIRPIAGSPFDADILVRGYPGDGVRITVADRVSNDRVLRALGEPVPSAGVAVA